MALFDFKTSTSRDDVFNDYAHTIVSSAFAVAKYDILCATFVYNNDAPYDPGLTVSDTSGNTWIEVGSPVDLNGAGTRYARHFYAIAQAANAALVVTGTIGEVGRNVDRRQLSITTYEGAAGVVIDVATSAGSVPAGSPNSSYSSPAFTTTAANELIVAMFSQFNTPTITPPTGFTERVNWVYGVQYSRVVSAIQTAVTLTAQGTGAMTWTSKVSALSFKVGTTSPVISTPVQTLTAVNRTTAGATIDSGGTTGTLYALARTGGSAALSGPIISGGQSNATTGTGAKTVPNTVLAAGTANQYVDLVYVDASNGTSNVVTVGPITTASALSFSGTIGTQTVTSGATVDIDLSSYWSGTGFGSLAYSSIGASIAGTGLSINSSGHLVGTAGAATSISGVQFRKADSGSPVSQADSNTFTLTITSGGGGDTTAPSITSTGTGGTNGPFSATVAENSTATFITFTSDEALASVTKAGTNGASYTLAGTGLTRTLARTTGFDYEAWVLAGSVPEVVTLAFADAAANVRNVTVNISPTNVNEPPIAPTIGTATAGDQTVSIAFTAPVNTGKPTITGYTATLSPGGITKTGASSPIVFGAGDGIVNDTAYTGVVKATNSEGTGPDSSASNSVTPTAGAPTGATINSQPLANNDNVLLPDTLLLWVGVRDFLTGDPVALHTNITTDSSAQFSLYDAALNVDGRYLVDWVTEDFQHGRAEAVGE